MERIDRKMTLFRRDYSRPGPGVEKSEPRKKGVARVVEIITRDFGNLVKLNIIVQICLLPSQVFMILAALFLGSVWSVLFVLLALAAMVPVGGVRTSLCHCISKMQRDEPGFIWHDFKKAFRANFRSTIAAGIIYEFIAGVQIFFAMYYITFPGANSFITVVFVISLLVLNMIAPYFFLQTGYIELDATQIIKNSILLAITNLRRSIGGALFGGVLVFLLNFANLYLFYTLVPIIILFGHSLPGLFALSFIWPPVNEVFAIEKTINMRKEKLDNMY